MLKEGEHTLLAGLVGSGCVAGEAGVVRVVAESCGVARVAWRSLLARCAARVCRRGRGAAQHLQHVQRVVARWPLLPRQNEHAGAAVAAAAVHHRRALVHPRASYAVSEVPALQSRYRPVSTSVSSPLVTDFFGRLIRHAMR